VLAVTVLSLHKLACLYCLAHQLACLFDAVNTACCRGGAADMLRNEFLAAYGHQHLLTLTHLERAGELAEASPHNGNPSHSAPPANCPLVDHPTAVLSPCTCHHHTSPPSPNLPPPTPTQACSRLTSQAAAGPVASATRPCARGCGWL
jgi:hypothetical protein